MRQKLQPGGCFLAVLLRIISQFKAFSSGFSSKIGCSKQLYLLLDVARYTSPRSIASEGTLNFGLRLGEVGREDNAG